MHMGFVCERVNIFVKLKLYQKEVGLVLGQYIGNTRKRTYLMELEASVCRDIEI